MKCNCVVIWDSMNCDSEYVGHTLLTLSDIWRRFGPSGCQALNIDESLYKKIAFHLRDGVVGIDTFGDLQKQVKQEMVAQMFHYTKWKADESRIVIEIEFRLSLCSFVDYMPPKEEKEEKREKETQHKDFAKDRQREEQREKDTTHKEKERDRGDSKLAHSTSGRKVRTSQCD